MTDTRFTNATGLSAPQHYATAADLATLAAALIRDYPEFYPIYAQKEFRYNNITQANRNRLLWTDPHVDGVKTVTLKGDDIAGEFQRIVERYVAERYTPAPAAEESSPKEPAPASG